MKQAGKLYKAIIAAMLVVLALCSCAPLEADVVDTDVTFVSDADQQKEESKTPMPLSNTLYRLTNDKELTILYYGGSITYGQGASKYENNWVAGTTAWFKQNYPDANITEINSGVGNTGSNYGIFRFEKDVLSIGTPDLIFLEFTSNDWGRFGEQNISRQTESLIRRIYSENPFADIVFVYTTTSENSNCRKASDTLAEHYGLITVDCGGLIRETCVAEHGGDITPLMPDKIHPNDDGYALYTSLISDALSSAIVASEAEFDSPVLIPAVLPDTLNSSGLFLNPIMLEVDSFPLPQGFERKSTKFTIGKSITGTHFIETKTPGAEFEFSFSGTGFGLLVYKSPDVSDIAYSVDGGEYINYSIGDMHYYNHTQMYIMEYDLPDGEHTVKIKNVPSPAKSREKDGETLRIISVCVNESAE